MPSKDKYTDPELREQVKEELKGSDKGGAPGQWSARKAQMMASEYKKRGGGYTTDKANGQEESQKSLSKWGDEEWQTKDGEGEARQEDGSRKRYLPKKAWEQMDDTEQNETDEKKQAFSKQGQQYVSNTEKANQSRKKASQEETKDFEDTEAAKPLNKNDKNVNRSKHDGSMEDESIPQENLSADDPESDSEDEEPYQDADEAEGEEKGSGENEDQESDYEEMDANEASDNEKSSETVGRKRGRKTSGASTANKSQKSDGGKGNASATVGSKHDSIEAPSKQGSADRLPRKGDRVSWKALPGWVHGQLVEVVTTRKEVDGKNVKGSEKDPRFVLQADSGKTCVHKPEACYYD